MISYPELAITLGAVMGIVLVGAALNQIRQARRALSWPTIEGRIVTSELEDGPSRGRPIPVASHRANITYTYEVAGREWTSRRVVLGDDKFTTGDDARDRVRKYEPGSIVTVFYDPSDPSQTLLEPGAWPQVMNLLMWLALAAISVVLVLLTSR